MNKGLNYVSSIQDKKIVIICTCKDKITFLKLIGAKKKLFQKDTWHLNYLSEWDLCKKLVELKDNNFMFGGGAYGWPPAKVFCYLRKKYNLRDEITEIVWTGSNKSITRKV